MLLALLGPLAMAGAPLIDAGRPVPDAPVALIVTTPCVDPTAWLGWAEVLEGHGFDAWLFALPPRGQEPQDAAAELRAAADELHVSRGPLVVAAHGYGGVLALMAELPAERLALVGTPLGPHAAPVVAQAPQGPVAEGLPWPQELVGELPGAPCSGELARSYVDWATIFPDFVPPTQPVLLLASDMDPVAPPETVRRPSQGWPGRSWHRVGIQSLGLHDPTHAELLLEPRHGERVAEFLADGS